MQTMMIPRCFRGPPNSGNGGYVEQLELSASSAMSHLYRTHQEEHKIA
jgi:hypothetical protein